jgi:hypothetical protein
VLGRERYPFSATSACCAERHHRPCPVPLSGKGTSVKSHLLSDPGSLKSTYARVRRIRSRSKRNLHFSISGENRPFERETGVTGVTTRASFVSRETGGCDRGERSPLKACRSPLVTSSVPPLGCVFPSCPPCLPCHARRTGGSERAGDCWPTIRAFLTSRQFL